MYRDVLPLEQKRCISTDPYCSPGKLRCYKHLATCSISVNPCELFAYLRMECTVFLRACPTSLAWAYLGNAYRYVFYTIFFQIDAALE